MTNPFRRFDLWDKFEFYGVIKVRELAELLQIAPQLIYHRLRNNKLHRHVCDQCGAEGLISLDEAREVFPALDKVKVEAEEAETARQSLAASEGDRSLV